MLSSLATFGSIFGAAYLATHSGPHSFAFALMGCFFHAVVTTLD